MQEVKFSRKTYTRIVTCPSLKNKINPRDESQSNIYSKILIITKTTKNFSASFDKIFLFNCLSVSLSTKFRFESSGGYFNILNE